MQYQFLNIFLEQKELFNQKKGDINPFLLENNSSQIQEIYSFYKSDVSILYVNGFLGTGKAELINYSTNFLSAETIVLKYNCFNSTILDDILLFFYSEFKKMSAQNIITDPQIKSENFTQKINSYFSQVEKPFVIIIDSFEKILEENRQEILDFIFHLNSMQKIKIIIIGRTFDNKYFSNVTIERITVSELEKKVFEKYLKAEKIKAQNAIIDEFYKHTKGYYFFTAFSIQLMKNDKLSLVDFLINLKNSFLPLAQYLEKQALRLVPASEKNLFVLLALIRHPLSIDLLKKLNLYDENTIQSLIKNLVIVEKNSLIYAQDYFKEIVDETTSSPVLQRVHQYIIDLYLTQLPLKPLERNICISRQTMRKEIEYHTLFLPKKPKNTDNSALDINYFSYAKTFDLGDKPRTEEDKKEGKQPPIQIDLPSKKNISINLENLPFQQNEKKANIAHEAKNTTEENSNIKPEIDSSIQTEFEELNLDAIMEMAKQSEIRYNYPRAIDLYQKALLMTDDKNYYIQLPLIYTKLARANQKNADSEKALEYYNLAQNFYEKEQNFIKANYIKLNIAKIFYETYKIEDAKKLYIEIVNSKNSPASLIVKTYLQLANLEESLPSPQNAFEYYRNALEHSDETMSSEILSELYFKYALTMDDKNDTKTAIEFYNKCIKLGGDTKINKFLSPAYSNIATLYLEKNDTDNAIKNYQKAYEIDKQNNNLEGIYYSSSKLASILQKKQPEEALKYFNISLDCANLIKDTFYIVSAHLAIGDYYYDKNKNEIALKYYINALDTAENNLSQDNISKINIRINDIKFKVGVEKFDELVGFIRTERNDN